MNNFKRYLFSKTSVKYNTYIGGIGSVITTKQQLVDRLNIQGGNTITLSNITEFQKIGNDIRYYINIDYDITYCFLNFGSTPLGNIITYLIDVEDKMKDFIGETYNGFMRQYGISFVKLEGLNIVDGSCFRETDIEECYLPNAIEIRGGRAFSIMSELKTVYIPNATVTGTDETFQVIPNGVEIYCKPGEETSTAISYAVNNENAIAIPVLNQTPSSPITDLSVTNVVGNDWQFNFTTPISLNTIQNYRVFAFNGTILSRYKYNDIISASGDTLTLPNDTSRVWIKVADQYLNLSDKSNTVIL